MTRNAVVEAGAAGFEPRTIVSSSPIASSKLSLATSVIVCARSACYSDQISVCILDGIEEVF
jgi:hypothetical protein